VKVIVIFLVPKQDGHALVDWKITAIVPVFVDGQVVVMMGFESSRRLGDGSSEYTYVLGVFRPWKS
jgi:hypothetical protein